MTDRTKPLKLEYFKSQKSLILAAIRIAIQSEAGFIDAHLTPYGIDGDKSKLSRSARRAVDDSEATIRDWHRYVRERL